MSDTNNMNTMPQYYTSEEICARFHISRITLYRYISAGIVTPAKVARKYLFTDENIQQIIERGKQK